MPMKTSGAASRQHRPRLRRPIPGSISTGTTPALNRAKTSEKKSSPGRTITTARVPRRDPDRLQAMSDPIAVLVELTVGQVRVAHAAGIGLARSERPRPAM